VWVKGNSGDRVRLQPLWSNASGQEESGAQDIILPDSNWHYLTYTKTPNYNHDSVSLGYIYFRGAAINNKLYVLAPKIEYGAATPFNTLDEYKPALSFAKSAIYYTEETQEAFFDNEVDVDAYAAQKTLSQEEADLFKERLEDYYIILEDEITDNPRIKKTKEALLTYYIKPELKKQWTNNTILASVYRYKRIYEGAKAQFTPTFGTKGTNGTDYTLSLSMVKEIDVNGTEYNNPPAWTWGIDITPDVDTDKILLNAQLFNPNDEEVQDVTYTWSFLFPANGTISGVTIFALTNGNWLERRGAPWTGNTASNIVSKYVGTILKCEAKINNGDSYTGYLIVPMRRSRDFISLEGPSIIRYDSSGVNPKYYDAPYRLLNKDEEAICASDYDGYARFGVSLAFNETLTGVPNAEIAPYYPVIKTNNKDHEYHLYPRAMYYRDVPYIMTVFVSTNTNGWYS